MGAVLGELMDLRGISNMAIAGRCLRSGSTINMVRNGALNPHRILVAELAKAPDTPAGDLLASPGWRISHDGPACSCQRAGVSRKIRICRPSARSAYAA